MTRRAWKWLTEVIVLNRAAFLAVCGAIGVVLAVVVYFGVTEARHAREQRDRNAEVNRQQDVTDYNLRQAIKRLGRLERPTRSDVQRLIRLLGKKGQRQVLQQLLGSASPRQLQQLSQQVQRNPPAGIAPPTAKHRHPSTPTPAAPQPTTPGPLPNNPVPSPPHTIDPPPIDLDGNGPLPPIDVPALPLPLP